MSRILPSLKGATFVAPSVVRRAGNITPAQEAQDLRRAAGHGLENFKTRAASPFVNERKPGASPTLKQRFAPPLGLSKAQMTELTARMIADADLNPRGDAVITKLPEGKARGVYRADKPRGGAAPRGLWSAVK